MRIRTIRLIVIAALLIAIPILMYDDTIDNRGTPLAFDTQELTDLGGSHEQIVVAFAILAVAVAFVPSTYIRNHPFKFVGWVAVVWLLAIAEFVLLGLARWPPCWTC